MKNSYIIIGLVVMLVLYYLYYTNSGTTTTVPGASGNPANLPGNTIQPSMPAEPVIDLHKQPGGESIPVVINYVQPGTGNMAGNLIASTLTTNDTLVVI